MFSFLRAIIGLSDSLICNVSRLKFYFSLKLILNYTCIYFSFPVPLGSITELPGDTCAEIKASEGGQAVSGTYWLDSIKSGNSILAYCDMKTESKCICHLSNQTSLTSLIYANVFCVVADYCIKHHCFNNATCVNRHVNYTCVCESGWTGNYCERGKISSFPYVF